jgi:hypothetical protein
MGFMERHHIAQRIAIERAKAAPMTWAAIAAEEGLGISTVRNLHRKYMAYAQEAPDSKDLVDEHLFMLSEIISEMASMVEHGDNSASKIGAAKVLVETTVRRIELLQAAGRVPRRLYVANEHRGMAAMVEDMAQVVTRHEMSDEVIVELRAVVARHDPALRRAT